MFVCTKQTRSQYGAEALGSQLPCLKMARIFRQSFPLEIPQLVPAIDRHDYPHTTGY